MNELRGPLIDGRSARLVLDAPAGDGPVDGVVLVLHGGRARSTAPAGRTQLAVVRMVPFVPAVRRAAQRAGLRVVVARLQHRVRGWNGSRRDPVVDATWALAALRERFGDVPVVLLGHSMGGRTAFALADAPGVAGVVGLAPWVEPADPVPAPGGRRVFVRHGTADRMTDPAASRAWVESAARLGADATYEPVEGAGHTMLGHAGDWHRAAADAAVAALAGARQDVPELGTPTVRRQP